MKEFRFLLSLSILFISSAAHAQLGKGSFNNKSAQDFIYYVREAQAGRTIPIEKASEPFRKFLEEAKKTSDLKAYLDSYFQGYNEEAMSWLKDNKVKVSVSDSTDGFTKFMALRTLHEHFSPRDPRQRKSLTKYDGEASLDLYAGASAEEHLKIISSDAFTKLGYNTSKKIGEADLIVKAPEGWVSYKTESDGETKEDKYVFKMEDGTEKIVVLPSDKSVAKMYSRKVSRSESEEEGADGSRIIRRSTDVSGRRFTGFYISNGDVQSDPKAKIIVIDKDGNQSNRNDLGDLTTAKKIFVDSPQAAIQAIQSLSKLKAEGKISFKPADEIQDLFGTELPGNNSVCKNT